MGYSLQYAWYANLDELTGLIIPAVHLGRLICKLPLDVENNKLFEEIMTDFHLDKKYSI